MVRIYNTNVSVKEQHPIHFVQIVSGYTMSFVVNLKQLSWIKNNNKMYIGLVAFALSASVFVNIYIIIFVRCGTQIALKRGLSDFVEPKKLLNFY